ncbi:hypothetical protein PHYSODRAFT_305767 [Phytophthora sojae]|uniref:START domain-containing protein n=1 Tax=Phytophthora sojae (strain P6497) TaxID=1094619 RepID=G5A6H3_PHYSP|nr:hypothetical protein PHYSODRAFT_305767 [Phytophthora sojae]EGZ08928.1 hypothetical protein PHYSODRAFT_305767 [Phytophthora sojae]|eukprot:XP_009535561.1 hypothetical protein PHYSODRAFT_305767 [Phytophthora sojae]
MWEVMKFGVISNECCACVFIRSEDMVASQGCFTQPLENGGSVKIRSQCLMKRIVVQGSIVFVESITEWVARPSCSAEWSHVTRDYGWVTVLSVASMPGMCQLQTVIRLQSSESMMNDPASSLLGLSDVIIPALRMVLRSRYQLVDKALLDSSRAAPL